MYQNFIFNNIARGRTPIIESYYKVNTTNVDAKTLVNLFKYLMKKEIIKSNPSFLLNWLDKVFGENPKLVRSKLEYNMYRPLKITAKFENKANKFEAIISNFLNVN